MSEALRAHERERQVDEQGARDDQRDDVGAAHTRSRPSSSRNIAANASSAQTTEPTSWRLSRIEAKGMPRWCALRRQARMGLAGARVKISSRLLEQVGHAPEDAGRLHAPVIGRRARN